MLGNRMHSKKSNLNFILDKIIFYFSEHCILFFLLYYQKPNLSLINFLLNAYNL